MLDMMEYHKMLRGNKITLVYSGPLWAEGIGGFAGTIKKRLEFDELPLEMSQAVFSVFVEQMSNMLMYSAEKEQFDSPDEMRSGISKGTFILGKQGKKYFMQTGNVIKSETASLVKERIDYLNALDKLELRKYHKEQSRLSKFGCNYYEFIELDAGAVNRYRGEYMFNYSWAEMTTAALSQKSGMV